jgi:hypothetical protein
MPQPNAFFKMTESNGTTACVVLIRPADKIDAVTPLDFKTNAAGDYVASQPLSSGRYFIEWVMLSNPGGTIAIDIADGAGKPVRPSIKDTNETGKAFKWNANEFTIAAAGAKTP